jgi:hypothetical protein
LIECDSLPLHRRVEVPDADVAVRARLSASEQAAWPSGD